MYDSAQEGSDGLEPFADKRREMRDHDPCGSSRTCWHYRKTLALGQRPLDLGRLGYHPYYGSGAVLLLCAGGLCAQAGVWAVSYSGGDYTVTGDECPSGHVVPYASYNGGWGGGGTTEACPNHNPPPPAGPRTVSCQGSVSVTLTWIPQGAGDDVPTLVVLRKESTANWSGGTSGSCANGLGDAPVGGVSTGVRYDVLQNPTSPIQLRVSPSASVTASPTSDVGTASVVVKVSAVVPSLSFAGTLVSTPPESKPQDNILVGQLLRSTVSLGGLPTGPTDEFVWTVSAGSPFNNYSASDTLGTFTPFAPPNASVAEWFFGEGMFGDPMNVGDGKPAEVACTVKLKEPEPDIEFTLKRGLLVFEPKLLTTGQIPVNPKFVIGTVQLLPNAQGPHSLRLWGVECPPSDYAGITWQSAMTPVTFFSNGSSELFGWYLLGTAKLEWQRAGDPLRKNQNFGLEGLDFGAPYRHVTYPVDSTVHCTSDAPGYFAGPMTDPQTECASMDFTFKLNLMYKPPSNGLGTCGVPVCKPTSWFCRGKATPGNPWVLSANGQGILPNLNPARVFFVWTRSLQDGLTWDPP